MFGEDGIDLAFKQAIALPDLLASGDDHKCQAVVPAIEVDGRVRGPR